MAKSFTFSHSSFLNSVAKFPLCRILNFTVDEAKVFMKLSNATVDDDKLYKLTHYNPFLVSLLAIHYDVIENYQSVANDFMSKHVVSIFIDMKCFNDVERFYRVELESLYYWCCKADNNIPTNKSRLLEFKKSWGAKENILFYIVKGDNFEVKSAMPCLKFLFNELKERVINMDSLQHIPAVQGFMYERKVLDHTQKR